MARESALGEGRRPSVPGHLPTSSANDSAARVLRRAMRTAPLQKGYIVNVSEQLNKAADLLRERGWIGTGGLGWEVEGGPLCIEGAIAAAMGDAISKFGGFTTGPNLCPAGLAVRDYLELGEYSAIGKGLFTWNDEAERIDGVLVSKRTQAEVIEVLRAAALIEQARESERESAQVPA